MNFFKGLISTIIKHADEIALLIGKKRQWLHVVLTDKPTNSFWLSSQTWQKNN